MSGNKTSKKGRTVNSMKKGYCSSGKSGISREQKWRIQNKLYPPIPPPQLPTMANLINEIKEVSLQSKKLIEITKDNNIDLIASVNGIRNNNVNLAAQSNVQANQNQNFDFDFKCDKCTKTFLTRQGLAIHKGRVHKFD